MTCKWGETGARKDYKEWKGNTILVSRHDGAGPCDGRSGGRHQIDFRDAFEGEHSSNKGDTGDECLIGFIKAANLTKGKWKRIQELG